MLTYILIIISAIIGYLLGSISTACLVSKVVYHDDIRKHGSGNAGMTNMLRTYGKKAAVVTFFGDFLKGIIAALIGAMLLSFTDGSIFDSIDGMASAGGFAIIGHNWPLFYQFEGGKGVLTSFSVMLLIAPIPTLAIFALFIVIVAIFRYVSLASMTCAFLLPFEVYFLGDLMKAHGGLSATFYLSVFIALLIIIRHKGNIERLIAGKESKISFSKKK